MRNVLIATLFVVLFGGCASTQVTPVSSEDFTRFEDDEKRLWVRSEEEQEVLDESGFIYEDAELEGYLNDVAKKIEPPNVYEVIPFRVKVIKNPHLNAFAYPNGVIYIHTGILARMENEAQLATLLAHEMTHSTHRHALSGFRDFKNKAAFFATLQVATAGFGGYADLANLLGYLGTMASITGYSRELESEADSVGFSLMTNAGYDPEESPKLFVHIKKELEEEKISEPFFFGTHPRIRERIESYEKLLNTMDTDTKGGVVNREIFQEKTQRMLVDNAVLDLKAGRFNAAMRGVEKFMTLQPGNAEACSLLGDIFSERREEGDLEKAIENYEKARDADPSFPGSYRGLGLIYYKQGNKSLAKENLERYIALSPGTQDRKFMESLIEKCEDTGE